MRGSAAAAAIGGTLFPRVPRGGLGGAGRRPLRFEVGTVSAGPGSRLRGDGERPDRGAAGTASEEEWGGGELGVASGTGGVSGAAPGGSAGAGV